MFTEVNRLLCESNTESLFVTAWMGVIEISTGKMDFVNAGHNPPLVCRKDGEWEYLKQKSGFVLAGMEGMTYKMGELQLDKGDTLYLYTDGVTEATNINNDLFGDARLKNILNTCEHNTLEELLSVVKKGIDCFAGEAPQFDDISMLVLKILEKENEQ